jgi:hypothetical protein
MLLRCAAVAAFASGSVVGQTPAPQTFPLSETTGLITRNVKVEVVEYLRTPSGPPDNGRFCRRLCVLPGTDFQDGLIEADIGLKLTTPKRVWNPGFVGIAFRARPDASHYELFLLSAAGECRRGGSGDAQPRRANTPECRVSDGTSCGGRGLGFMSRTRILNWKPGQK